MASLKQGAGYLIVDHKDSPGLKPEDVAHMPGAQPVGAGVTYESDTATCSHCGRGILFNPLRVRPRGYCPKCDHLVCDGCEGIRVKTGECIPMKRRIEELFGKSQKRPRGEIVLTDQRI